MAALSNEWFTSAMNALSNEWFTSAMNGSPQQ
jgi:hypothetical protein